MSVQTKAHEARDRARENINDAIDSLSIFLDPNTYRHDNFRDYYIEQAEEFLMQLIKMRRKL